jgi:hypothetical protein
MLDLAHATLAVGALGTSATGLVDATKAFGGGISQLGFGGIKKLANELITQESDATSGLCRSDAINTLRANWINGMSADDQKSIAKSLVKLHFNETTAPALAKTLNVSEALLISVARKLPAAAPLELAEADAYGRFDLAVAALIDKAYQNGDQLYRNSCKVLAMFFAIALAIVADRQLGLGVKYWECTLIGLIATPLAPIAKDIASAISSAGNALQSVKG